MLVKRAARRDHGEMVILRIKLLPLSATYTFPLLSVVTSSGHPKPPRPARSPAPPRSTASLRHLHPSNFLFSSGRLVSRTAGQTEAGDAVAIVRGVAVVAVGDGAEARNVDPAAPAEAAVGGIYNILAPLPHIPTHVVNT